MALVLRTAYPLSAGGHRASEAPPALADAGSTAPSGEAVRSTVSSTQFDFLCLLVAVTEHCKAANADAVRGEAVRSTADRLRAERGDRA